jgi:hypothetical protein
MDTRRNLAKAPPFKLDDSFALRRVYNPLLEELQPTYPQYVALFFSLRSLLGRSIE